MTTTPEQFETFLSELKDMFESFLQQMRTPEGEDAPGGFTESKFDAVIEQRKREEQMRDLTEHVEAIRDTVELMATRAD